MPRGRQPEDPAALSTAEHQARYHARQLALQSPARVKRRAAGARRSRTKRWNDALAEVIAIQAECAEWFNALPESPRDTAAAAALREMIGLDPDAIAAVPPPLGYGRD